MAAITLDLALRTARAFQQTGQLSAAETLYRQVLAVEPSRAELWSEVAMMAEADGRPEEAVVCLLRAVENAPNHAPYHFALGLHYRMTGRIADAIASYRQALALQPGHAEARRHLGQLEESARS